MAVFSVASNNLHDRVQEARALIEVIKRNEAEMSHEEETKILKGLFFVVVYGAIENCIRDCVTIGISYLNGLSLKVSDLRPELWAIAFNPDCTRIEQNSENKKWTNRNKLFIRLYGSKDVPNMDASLFPTSIGNIKMDQIVGVWNTFGIKDPVNPDLSKGYDQTLSSIALERMRIAHGRTTSAEVGASITAAEMQKKLNDIDYYCSYVISCFEKYIANGDFIM